MRVLLKVLLLPTVLLMTAADQRTTATRSPAALRGAWTLINSSLTTGDKTTTDSSPQPGLVLFTDRHYSLMYVEGSAPRMPFADPNPSRATDAEKLAAYDTFSGHSGSYLVSDSMVEMQVVVSKWPNLMVTNLRSTFARFAFRLAGDTLRLTRRGPGAVFTMTLLRAE
jgi:hypothetical protein